MKKFSQYAWFVTIYNVLVILWGAVVRATGSGAGCGNHWPKCNGEIIPRPERLETIIEFSHRLSSALAGVLVLVLLFWAYRVFGRRNLVRRWAWLSLFFIVLEGWIGMLLVRRDLVAYNVSGERAWMVAWHLTNTLLLLASLALTAWLAGEGSIVTWRRDRRLVWLLSIGLAAAILFNAAGAVTALGDTLFPPESLAQGLRQDMDPASNFLIQLRIIHPALAMLTSYYLFRVGEYLRGCKLSAPVERRVRVLYGVMALQLVGGFVNVFLLAPVLMQVFHLLLADIFWLALVLLAADVLTVKPAA